MPPKTTPSDSNVNTNNNTNNVNVNVHLKQPRKASVKKKPEPNWYTRTIIGGIIALILSICGYYIKNNLDAKGKANSTLIESNTQPIQPNN